MVKIGYKDILYIIVQNSLDKIFRVTVTTYVILRSLTQIENMIDMTLNFKASSSSLNIK